MVTDLVGAEVRGRVLIVSLNRPASRNAMNPQMAHAVARHLDELDASPELSVGVIHGSGGTFSAGMDLKHFRATGQRPLDPRRGGGGLVWQPPSKPLIAAVEGWALGLGFEMTLACDLIVAAEDARLGLPEVTHGMMAGGGGAIRLPSRLPRAAASEMLLTGRPWSAQRLFELGLINRVTAPGEALTAAVALAQEIAELPTDAVTLTKEIAAESRDWPELEMFARQEERLARLLESRRGDTS